MTAASDPPFHLTFHAVAEPTPGPAWRELFDIAWPGYRSWYLRQGEAARPGYATCRRMLRTHMPELLPTWEGLVELAGAGDLAARMLSLWSPPPYLAGCTQAAMAGPSPALVRNYDYAPLLLERVVRGTCLARRRVIGMSDCLWGLVDGMNESGLALSLAFGGRRVVGEGFGIPLVLRYVLETCDTVGEARRALARLPVHMAYNVTAVDAVGERMTAELGPDHEARFSARAAATNHQEGSEWPEQVRATRSRERQEIALDLLSDPAMDEQGLVHAFLRPPLYSTTWSLGFGTLYTAVYRPREGTLEYRWPGSAWRHSFAAFEGGLHTARLGEPVPA